jgi:hypothetical protein
LNQRLNSGTLCCVAQDNCCAGASRLGVGHCRAYLFHVRSTAATLITSASEIGSTEDAKRQIAAWKAREGTLFWTETDHPGGDHSYDAVIVNLPIARLHIVKPTGVTVSITLRDGELRSVTVIESTGWYPVAAVWVQEWFGEDLPKQFHVSTKGKPSNAAVQFPSNLPDAERRRAFAVNTACLVTPRGCRTADDILPGVWQLSPQSD